MELWDFQGLSPVTYFFSKVPFLTLPKVSVTFPDPAPDWRPPVQTYDLIWDTSLSNYHRKKQRENSWRYTSRQQKQVSRKETLNWSPWFYKTASPLLKILQGWLIIQNWNIPCLEPNYLELSFPRQQPFIVYLSVWPHNLVIIRLSLSAGPNKLPASPNPEG